MTFDESKLEVLATFAISGMMMGLQLEGFNTPETEPDMMLGLKPGEGAIRFKTGEVVTVQVKVEHEPAEPEETTAHIEVDTPGSGRYTVFHHTVGEEAQEGYGAFIDQVLRPAHRAARELLEMIIMGGGGAKLNRLLYVLAWALKSVIGQGVQMSGVEDGEPYLAYQRHAADRSAKVLELLGAEGCDNFEALATLVEGINAQVAGALFVEFLTGQAGTIH
jgi:hypothetical protein